MYHWSEAHHDTLVKSSPADLELWDNLSWTNRLMIVPSSLIDRLPSSSSFTPLTLQFRVWVRLVDADDPWTTSALSSAFDQVEVMVHAAPSAGSCDIVFAVPDYGEQQHQSTSIMKPQQLLQPLVAHETPLHIRCRDWIDPIVLVDETLEPHYRISMQLQRRHSSICHNSTSVSLWPSSGGVDNSHIGEIVVPDHSLISETVDAVALLPPGCWEMCAVVHSETTGQSTIVLLENALSVELPSKRKEFTTDTQYFQWVVRNELQSENPSLYYDVTAAVQNILDKADEMSPQELQSIDMPGLIRETRDTLNRVGTSRDLLENQLLIDITQTNGSFCFFSGPA